MLKRRADGGTINDKFASIVSMDCRVKPGKDEGHYTSPPGLNRWSMLRCRALSAR
jgi:hypothetical protein